MHVLNLLEEITSCQHLYDDLRIPPGCPECSQPLAIMPHGVLCPNEHCDFMAGGMTDLPQDYQGYIIAAYAARYPQVTEINWGQVAMATARQRALFEFFLKLARQKDATPSLSDAGFNRWLADRGIINARMNWWLLSDKQLRQLTGLLEGYELPPKIDITKPIVAIPYWGNHHSLSAIQFMGSENQNYGVCRIRPFRHSWAGLWRRGLCFNEDSLTAAQAGHMSLLFLPTSNHICSPFANPAYCPIPQPLDSWNIRGVGDLAASVAITIKFQEKEWLWPSFITAQVHRALTAGIPVETIQTFIDNAGLLPNQRCELAASLERSGNVAIVRQLQETCLTTVLKLDEKWKLVAAPFSYMAGKPNKTLEALTNFTWEPSHMVLFDDSQPWIYGDYRSRDIRQTAKVQSKDLDSPNAFLDGLRKSLPTEEVPAVYSKENFLPLLTLWRQAADVVPRRHGCAHLGWSHDRKKFVIPGTVVTADGRQERSNPEWHPQALPLHHFQTAAMPRGLAELPESAANERMLLCALAGGISRIFRNAQAIPLAFPESMRSSLQSLFAATTGQPFPLNLAQNDRGQGKDIVFNGYPVLVNQAPLTLLDNLLWTTWMLGGETDIVAFYSPQQCSKELQDAFRSLLFSLPEKLLKEGVAPHVASVDLMFALLDEGSRHVPGAKVVSRYPAIDALLQQTDSESLRTAGALDFVSSTIALPVSGASDALLREASLLCRAPAKIQNELLILPTVPATRMLTNFYGFMPKLKVVDGS